MNANDKPDTAIQPVVESSVQAAPETQIGFAALSRKIRSRTTDLLAVAIIVAGGLGVGSQVAHWWATNENDLGPQAAADINLTWGDGGAPVTLEFGDRPFQLQRQTVRGDRKLAMTRLVEECARVAERTLTPGTKLLPAEQKLLGLLKSQQPVLQGDGTWQVYRIERPMTLVIATRDVAVATKPPGQSGAAAESNRQPDQPLRRVVCWGMAQPSGKGLWVLFTLQPTEKAIESRPEIGRVELPGGSRKIMSLRDATGGALIAFEGEAAAGDWRLWFDDWFARHRWEATQRWTESPVGWSAAFRPADKNSTGRIDVSFSPVGKQRLSGMISITTPATEIREGLQP